MANLGKKQGPTEHRSRKGFGYYTTVPGTSPNTFKVPVVLNQGFKTTMWSRTAGLFSRGGIYLQTALSF